MEISPVRERITYFDHIITETAAAEKSMEMIVPDAMPDVGRILSAEGEVFVRGKDADGGKVTVHGVVRVSIMYMPETDMGLHRVSMEIPYNLGTADARITVGTRVVTRVWTDGVEAVTLNPRKISARAAVNAMISCYNETSADMPTADGLDDVTDIEILTGETETALPCDVREKTIVVTDEVTLPAGPVFEELLSSRCVITPEETKVVGTKLIFRGTAHTDVLYASEDGEIFTAGFHTEFSQIMELEKATPESEFEIIPIVTGAYTEPIPGVEADAKRLSLEIHAAIQVVAVSRQKMRYISDAYGTKYETELSSEQIRLPNRAAAYTNATVLRGTIPASGAARVISMTANAGLCGVRTENGETTVFSTISVSGIYAEENGTLYSAAAKVEASVVMSGLAANSAVTVRAETGRDLFGVASDGGIEFRVPVEFFAAETRPAEFAPVFMISYNEEEALDISARPSLVITRVKQSDTLWSVSKRYRAARLMIREANGMEDDNLVEGEMLVIPKKR